MKAYHNSVRKYILVRTACINEIKTLHTNEAVLATFRIFFYRFLRWFYFYPNCEWGNILIFQTSTLKGKHFQNIFEIYQK